MKCVRCGEETGTSSFVCSNCLLKAAGENSEKPAVSPKKRKNSPLFLPLVIILSIWAAAFLLFLIIRGNGEFYKVTVVDETDFWVEDGILFDSVYASSALTDKYGTVYPAENLCDLKLETSWIEGVDGNGEGEYILFSAAEKKTVRRIDIINGYQASKDHYFRNSRIKKCLVELDGGVKFSVDFFDDFGKKTIVEFKNPISTSTAKITIEEVYGGTRFEDTSITEIVFA
ncbi:MAG: hypothetical protein IJS17_00540 [Clostridia bacterium]|nr:hypothetical protein [Clostridia bacterium]